VRAAIVETPAGFEPNSEGVARKIGDYLSHRLQNFQPQIMLVAARKRNSAFDPNDPEIAAPIFTANYIFMGPGSPTYAVRQLRDTFTWHAMQVQHRRGAALCFSSAASLAISRHTIPVYEIYKVGEDLHWQAGLDFFGAFGISLVIVPHWNNNDGGAEVDTSHCYMGAARYERLIEMLPPTGTTILGIEENTGLIIRPHEGMCEVIGAGGVVVIGKNNEQRFGAQEHFSVFHLGDWRLPDPEPGISTEVMGTATIGQEEAQVGTARQVPREVLQLSHLRQEARRRRDWQTADRIRNQIADMGWQVIDTPKGSILAQLLNDQ
jgi:cyanophycinase-like exopeptidase